MGWQFGIVLVGPRGSEITLYQCMCHSLANLVEVSIPVLFIEAVANFSCFVYQDLDGDLLKRIIINTRFFEARSSLMNQRAIGFIELVELN